MDGRGDWKSHQIPYFKSVGLILEAWNLDRRYLLMDNLKIIDLEQDPYFADISTSRQKSLKLT